MDLKSPSSHSHSHEGVRKGSLNLKETSKKDGKRNVVEAPSTPGRPVFSFSVASRKNPVPSKWNDAEKWLISDHQNQNQNHHLHGFVKPTDFVSKKSSNEEEHHQPKATSEEKVSNHHHHDSDSFDVLKDKLVEPSILKFECMSESFLFKEAVKSSRDIGTEMTPLGTSTCPTPFKALSPPRHNTPATRSGPLDPNNSLDIQECHLAKLNQGVGVLNWSSREEEEEDISKSLRHTENEYCRISISDRVCAWEEQHKTNCCLRYQREETKIQAWVDLQNAKAEAQSRKLEALSSVRALSLRSEVPAKHEQKVKIQKMRSKFEEKLMRKMAIVHKKADELRAAAQLEHIQQLNEEAKKSINLHNSSCGCFPCNNLHP